ncbi:MAG: triose-phosphate isomerase [Gemmatimonadales bacterium]
MSRPLLFAANWKMHVTPGEARTYMDRFLKVDEPRVGRNLAFFPPAVSIEAVARALAGHDHAVVGAQDVHWEPKGAFTGATSVSLARGAGAAVVLVGHSERRHVFGDTDHQTRRKLDAVVAGGLQVMLCVGETLDQREAGQTDATTARQLRSALEGVDPGIDLAIAYEPVWAIGTGRNATPDDAARAHRGIRNVLQDVGFPGETRVLYGGSVNAGNVGALLAERELDGVLVGGASLDPDSWAAVCAEG